MFLLSNLFILLLICCGFQSLPGQSTTEEVHEHMSECFEIISSRLLSSKVCVDTHVSGCTGQRLSFPIWNMLLRLRLSILFCHAKIDDMNDICGFGVWTTNKEVVGFYVAVDEILFVNRLDSRQLQLVSNGQYALKELQTICFATMTTVLMENLRLQWSNRSSRLGPSRSITRMLCKPSWPK